MSQGWVCPECGLDYGTLATTDLPVAIRSFPRRYRAELPLGEDEVEAVIRRRPDPDTWSALEYTAHVADIFDSFASLLPAMVRGADAASHVWDADERASAQQYDRMQIVDVLDRLATNAERLAEAMSSVQGEDWNRTAAFPWGERDVLTMGRNAVHEGAHHLRDLKRVVAAALRAG